MSGTDGTFIIEMTSDECTNYEWLTIVALNLAYWDGQADHAEFTKPFAVSRLGLSLGYRLDAEDGAGDLGDAGALSVH